MKGLAGINRRREKEYKWAAIIKTTDVGKDNSHAYKNVRGPPVLKTNLLLIY